MNSSESFIPEGLFERGIGHVIVTRRKSGGCVEAGVFLVDVYCLGVKEAFLFTGSEREFDNLLEGIAENEREVRYPPENGRKLVEDAVRYAMKLGFRPHRDYKKAARVFGGVDASKCRETFQFGKDGKPFFINGPHIPENKALDIVEHLRRVCGEGNFHFLIGCDTEDDSADIDWDNEDLEDVDDDLGDDGLPEFFLVSDSASVDGKPLPDAMEFAREKMGQFPFIKDTVTLTASDTPKLNFARLLLEMAEAAIPISKDFFSDGEENFKRSLNLIIITLNAANMPANSLNNDYFSVEQREFIAVMRESMADVPHDALPPLMVLDYKYTSSEETKNGKHRLVCLFMHI